MKLRFGGGSKLRGFHSFSGADEIRHAFIRFKPSEGEVRSEWPGFRVYAERHERSVDVRGQTREIRRSVHAAPDDAGTALVGEKPRAAESQFNELRGMNSG